jgi:hypothetical protein
VINADIHVNIKKTDKKIDRWPLRKSGYSGVRKCFETMIFLFGKQIHTCQKT